MSMTEQQLAQKQQEQQLALEEQIAEQKRVEIAMQEAKRQEEERIAKERWEEEQRLAECQGRPTDKPTLAETVTDAKPWEDNSALNAVGAFLNVGIFMGAAGAVLDTVGMAPEVVSNSLSGGGIDLLSEANMETFQPHTPELQMGTQPNMNMMPGMSAPKPGGIA